MPTELETVRRKLQAQKQELLERAAKAIEGDDAMAADAGEQVRTGERRHVCGSRSTS